MNIGILTIHHVTNYGAVWQAYALSKFVARLGHNVEIIDYRPPVAVKYYSQPFIKRMRPNFKRAILAMKFQNFITHQLPLSSTRCSNATELARASEKYDTLIAGSDQIWCTGEGSFRGYDSNFFLEYCAESAVQKISYAASAGNTRDFAQHSAAISKSLQAFSAIAVRDEPTFALVKIARGEAPTLVLDPVFLHDFSEIVGGVTQSNDLVVFADHPERFEALAGEIAKEHKLRIVSIGKPCRCADVRMQMASPVTWLRAMKGARAVLTDFFHGTALSLRFGRPLLVSAPQKKVAKITDLLRRVDLSHLFLENASEAKVSIGQALAHPEEFAQDVQRRLEPHQNASRNFLIDALHKHQKPQ